MPETSRGGGTLNKGGKEFLSRMGEGVKNFDQVWGGRRKFHQDLGGDNKLSKKGLKWGGTRLKPKIFCALRVQTLLS